jgi:hypothetical protein
MVKDSTPNVLEDGEEWAIYYPGEGHWPIPEVNYPYTRKEARQAYLKWSGRKILPKRSNIEPVLKYQL